MTKEELRNLPRDFSYVQAPEINLDGVELLIAFHSMKSEVDISKTINKAIQMHIPVVYSNEDPYCFDGIILSQIKCPTLMLVPGLAFTQDGKRLGRGKGFYDRTLSVIPSCVKTIGICKKSQLVKYIPTEPHDRNVDLVLAF